MHLFFPEAYEKYKLKKMKRKMSHKELKEEE